MSTATSSKQVQRPDQPQQPEQPQQPDQPRQPARSQLAQQPAWSRLAQHRLVRNPFTDPGLVIPRLTEPAHRPPPRTPMAGPLRSSIPLFDQIAARHDGYAAVPHRRAYDELAWEMLMLRIPPGTGTIVDAGCGSGRWAHRLCELGHQLIGIEQAPQMAAATRQRMSGQPSRAGLTSLTSRFRLVESSMESADLSGVLPGPGADVVLALGSMQFTSQPNQTLRRLAGWARPGGLVMVLVDSLTGVAQEMLARGDTADAVDRLENRIGIVRFEDHEADAHLLDATGLRVSAANAGLENVSVHGLLVSWSALGRAELAARLSADWTRQLAIERNLAGDPLLADLGKKLLLIGTRPQ